MTLRTRLTLVVLVLVMGAAITMAVASYGVVRQTTYIAADQSLSHALNERNGGPDDNGRPVQNPNGFVDFFYPNALGVSILANGQVTWLHGAGYADNITVPPNLTAPELQRSARGAITVEDPIPYRVQSAPWPGAVDGTYRVVAVPVQYEKEHLQKVGFFLAIGVLLVSILGAFLAWLLVRSSLKPVDSMIEVAGDIANGDLERRVPAMKEGTELGDLAHSLNTMIASIEASLHEREESEMTMRRFLGDASHELRTPLTVIRGYAELLGNEQVLDDTQRARAIQRLDTESTRMETLVLDLLNLARLDEHRPLSIRPVDIAQLIRDALDDLRIQQPNRDITIAAPASAIVCGDETRLRQVMSNLVGNIRSYTPDDSAVHATVTIADNQKWHDKSLDVVLTLDDSGPGIPDEQRELARQRFGRLDSSRARATGGFGLGLSIVDAVVKAHEGDFELAESPTRGLRVIVRLPVDGPVNIEEELPVVRADV
jgi:two-component system OmpR family sensor kinase